MPIKIFFKHLFTSIKKRPAQPILLIIVIALSVALCNVAFNSKEYLDYSETLTIESSEGNSDFSVQLSSSADTRFLFETDVKDIIGDKGETCGTYNLPILYGDDFEYGIAADYTKYCKMFNLSLLDSKIVHQSEIKNSVYISQQFAKNNNISVGDVINLSVFGIEKEFEVYGISKYPILGEYSILMDISSAIDLLSTSSIFVSLLEGDFIPSSKVFVDAYGDKEELIALIEDNMPNTICSSKLKDAAVGKAMDLIVTIIVLLTAFFSFAVIYCCFSVLTAQRKQENALFYAIGAKGYMLNLISIFEMLIYWLIGSIIGTLVSMPLSTLYINLSEVQFVEMYMTPWIIIVSSVISLVASLGSMLLFMYMSKKAKHKIIDETKNDKITVIVAIVLAAVMVVSLCLTFIPELITKTVFGVIGFFTALTLAIVLSKIIFSAIANKLSKSTKLSLPVSYALKNSVKVSSNKNATSVLAILFIIFAILMILVDFATRSMYYFQDKIDFDYATTNVDDETIDKLKDIEGVDCVYKLLYENITYTQDGETDSLQLISVSDKKGLYYTLGIDDIPHGNEVYMPETVCMGYHKEIGDTIDIHVGDDDYTLKIIGHQKEGTMTLIINAEDLGINCPYTAIIIDEDANQSVVKEKIANTLALGNSVLISKDDFLSYFKSTSLTYIVYIEFVTVFLVVFALIGILDSVVASYISRKEEFNNYMRASMSKSGIRKLIASEVMFMLLVALIAFIILFMFEFFGMYEILYSYHCNFFFVYQ